MVHESWRAMLTDAPAGKHVALLYRESGFLTRCVAAWSAEPLRRDGAAILLATRSHLDLVRHELRAQGIDVAAAEGAGRFLAIDAHELMPRFLSGGVLDHGAFRRAVEEIVQRARAAAPGEVRAWGEMVNVLRARGDANGSRRLEDAWNDAIGRLGISLLCSYQSEGAFGAEGGVLADVLTSHTHVLPEPGLAPGGAAPDVTLR